MTETEYRCPKCQQTNLKRIGVRVDNYTPGQELSLEPNNFGYHCLSPNCHWHCEEDEIENYKI